MLQLPGVERIQDPDLRAIIETIQLAFTDLRGLVFVGTGSPNGVVTASPPAMYFNRAGGAGTTWYAKETGAGTNTGWVGK